MWGTSSLWRMPRHSDDQPPLPARRPQRGMNEEILRQLREVRRKAITQRRACAFVERILKRPGDRIHSAKLLIRDHDPSRRRALLPVLRQRDSHEFQRAPGRPHERSRPIRRRGRLVSGMLYSRTNPLKLMPMQSESPESIIFPSLANHDRKLCERAVRQLQAHGVIADFSGGDDPEAAELYVWSERNIAIIKSCFFHFGGLGVRAQQGFPIIQLVLEDDAQSHPLRRRLDKSETGLLLCLWIMSPMSE